MKHSLNLKHLFFILFSVFLTTNVFSTDSGKELSSSKETTALLLCNTPTGLYTTNITETSATFNWSAVSGAQNYSVQTRLPYGAWSNVPGSPFPGTSVTVDWLSPNTTYEWRVRTNCSYGEQSYWSSPVSFTTESSSSTCDVPGSLNTYNITSSSATWDWSSASGAMNYSVQWRYAGGSWNNLPGGPWTSTLLNVGGLESDTDYEWRVRSNCSYGTYSDWSYPESFTTLGYSCGTPHYPVTTNVTSNSASFSWTAVAGADNYTVQTRLPNGTWYTVSGSPFNNTSATVYGLNPATTYEWRVRANCGYNNSSDWTYPISFTTEGSSSCYVPGSLYTFNITATSATWDWSSASGAMSYSLQWRYAGGSWNNLPGGPWTSTLVNVSGLQPDTDYEWRVRSNCSYGTYSDWSYPESFTTLGYSCETPHYPVTTNITSNSATFSWTAVAGADNYTVQTRLPNGTWYNVPGSPFNNTSVTVNGLDPGTTYEWRVRANCGYSNYSNWTAPISFTTSGSSSCDPPEYLYTTNVTQTSATLDWSTVYGAVSYSLQYRLANGTWYDVPGGPWTNSWYTLSGLQPGTAYQWRVRSNCSYGNYSPWSYSANFTTLGNSCGTPHYPVTTNVTSTSATFSWTAVSGAQSYSVQTRLPNGTWYYVPGSPFNSTSITVNNLNPNTTYEWRVRANCGYENYSNWTSPVSFTTDESISCNPPAYLYTTNITQTSAILDWSTVAGATSYSLQYRLANGTWYDVPGGPFTSSWHTLAGLQPSTSYEWRVKSNCGYGNYSAWSYSAYFTTLGASCETPHYPVTTNITSTSATFSWTAVAGAQNYSVETRLPNGTWYTVPGSPFTNTSVTVYGLNPGTTYEWRVRANCGYGTYSNWTSPISFTTSGSVSCNAPASLYTTNITQTSATLDWSTVNGATSYSVQYRLANGTWYDVPGGPFTSSWYTLNGLQPSTAYEWRVRSNCGYGNYSPWSYSAYFTTLGASCGTPHYPVTTNITSTSATFSWTAVAGAQSYSVQTRLPYGTWYTVPGSPFTNTSVTVDGLNPGTTYEWRVKANCGYNQYSNWTSPISFTTEGSSTCNAPSSLYTVNITQTSASWDWTSVPGAVSYSVQWRTAGGTWYNLPGGPWTSTWLNVAGLQPDTDYEWRVRSNCSYGSYSPWSDPASFTTLGSSCDTPENLYTSEITSSSATFNWSAVPGAQDYSVQYRLPYGTWSYLPGSPFDNTWVTLAWLNSGTTYEWRVRANCGYGDISYWSSPVSFTTSGGGSGSGNDNCPNAALLAVGNTCQYTSASNIGATQSTPAPMGGCPSYSHKDVWFRFTMPDVMNPTVTIRTTAGSLTDAVMEVYVGNDCSGLSYLTCEDDNTNGNGSNMPVINLIGYADAEIWVRVWGYNGSTGTFNICVFDYQSNSLGADEQSVIQIERELEEFEIAPDAESAKAAETSPLLRIAPNPVSDVLSVSFTQTEVCLVSGLVLTDISGKVVMQKAYQPTDLNTFNDELDVSALTPGIYVLQVVTTTGVFSEKVSVVN